jgi:hypothetical protein
MEPFHAATYPEYTYHAFGLDIRSSLVCPELIPGHKTADIIFRYGVVPETLESSTSQAGWFQAAPGKFLLRLPDIANYLIKDGKEIIIDPAPEASATEVRLILLGSAMGILLHQRGLLPLHASAIKLPGGATALFAGHSGIGKSTLAAAFRQRGYPVLTDDVSVISLDTDGRPVLLPGYPEIKLVGDAIEKIGQSLESLPRSRTLAEKYSLCFHEEYVGDKLPVQVVYVLGTQAAENFQISSFEGAAKLDAIIQQTYRLELLGPLGIQACHFKVCAVVANQVCVKQVMRPSNSFLLEELVDLLERDLQSLAAT